GADDFAGELLHSSAYRTDPARRGTRVVVIGTGNSGHDIARTSRRQGPRSRWSSAVPRTWSAVRRWRSGAGCATERGRRPRSRICSTPPLPGWIRSSSPDCGWVWACSPSTIAKCWTGSPPAASRTTADRTGPA
ncbi:hypothetical protein GS462_26690, partial [Rhodococcus hoagii]|nr:hypothetical protein [Prescottella equi]